MKESESESRNAKRSNERKHSRTFRRTEESEERQNIHNINHAFVCASALCAFSSQRQDTAVSAGVGVGEGALSGMVHDPCCMSLCAAAFFG
jgi:hypothetical protein